MSVGLILQIHKTKNLNLVASRFLTGYWMWGPQFLTDSWMQAFFNPLPCGPLRGAGYIMEAGVLRVRETMRVPE